MEIDLNQLPIPDWGLLCPTCRYPLQGLPSHRCPECGTDLDMETIVGTVGRLRAPKFTGDERPLPDFGFSCEKCRRPLTGATDDCCPHCSVPFDLSRRIPRDEWFTVDRAMAAGLESLALEAVFAAEGVPHLRTPNPVLDVVLGTRLFAQPIAVRREFFFEVCWHIQDARRRIAAARKEHDPACWTCPSCREQVPKNFEVCWNCGAPRSEVC